MKQKFSSHLIVLFELALYHIYIYSSNNNFYEKQCPGENLVKMTEFSLKNDC